MQGCRLDDKGGTSQRNPWQPIKGENEENEDNGGDNGGERGKG